MLETILAIGKAFRESATRLTHHRYIKQCPQDNEKNTVLRLSIPVNKNLSFDFDGIKEITDENVIKDHLFYLAFKTSDSDGLVKYVFGDIYYSLEKGQEGGYYRLADLTNKQKAYQVSSFLRGDKDCEDLEEILRKGYRKDSADFAVSLFRDEFRRHLVLIERMLKYQSGISEYLDSKRQGESTTFTTLLSEEKGTKLRRLTAKKVFSTITSARGAKSNFKKILGIEEPQWSEIESNEDQLQKLINYSTGDIFLHFDFGGRQWYEFANEFEIINAKLLDEFAEKSIKPDGYILKKCIYKTLSSAEKDRQFPYFHTQSRYRNKIFRNIAEVADLLYAIDYSKYPLIKIPYTDIKIIILPRGKNLTASHYEKFVRSETSLKDEQERETIIGQENAQSTQEQLFAPLTDNVSDDIARYDLIFSKRGGQSTPDVDMVEISGLERSHLREIDQRIRRIREILHGKRQTEINADLKPFGITWSFLRILRDLTSDIKKYQSHLYKVLPQIYMGTYYDDPILLPALIQKEEANIRAGKSDFGLLKYDFYFLMTIQNSIPEGGNLMSIQDSQSYKIGTLLGALARQFAAWREDCPIKSFEKSYVGTLSRRITTIPDVVRFKTFLEEKLILHDRTSFTHSVSIRLSDEIKALESVSEEKYDRHSCAFGFFESYFSR
jgi:hypothetical protein